MALFTESQVRAAAQGRVQKSYRADSRTLLLEKVEAAAAQTNFDIFLSHSVRDAELVLGTVQILETLGYRVYVDWIVDTQLDRSRVIPGTAAILRNRMRQSRSLFYLTSDNAAASKWMPWECGYFDGLKEKVAILPLTTVDRGNAYYGVEYLGLYPYVTYGPNTDGDNQIWIRPDALHYLWYPIWVQTPTAQLQWKSSQ